MLIKRDGSGFIGVQVLGEDEETPPEGDYLPGDMFLDPKLLAEGFVGWVYVDSETGWKKWGALET